MRSPDFAAPSARLGRASLSVAVDRAVTASACQDRTPRRHRRPRRRQRPDAPSAVVRTGRARRAPRRRDPRRAGSPRSASCRPARHAADPLDLKSSVALVIDQDTNEVLFSKNSEAVLPIASLTKLMTGAGRDRSAAAARRDAHGHRRRHRHREGQPLAPGGRHAADARRNAAPGADVVGEPRRPCAGPQLPGRPCRRSSRR